MIRQNEDPIRAQLGRLKEDALRLTASGLTLANKVKRSKASKPLKTAAQAFIDLCREMS